jgi:hypothetical protein
VPVADVGIVDKKTFSADVLKSFVQADKELTAGELARRDSLLPLVDNKVSSIRVYALRPQEA